MAAYSINEAFHDRKYLKSLQILSDQILYSKPSVSLDNLKSNNIFSQWYEKLDKASKEKVEKSKKIEDNETINEKSLDKSSMLVDIHFSINSIIQYIDFLSKKFPNINVLNDLMKAAEGYWYENSNLYKDRYKKAIHDFIEVVNIEDLLAATNEYNETVREKSIEARKEKDKELLEKGLITKKEYEERQCIDVENDKKENKSH